MEFLSFFFFVKLNEEHLEENKVKTMDIFNGNYTI